MTWLNKFKPLLTSKQLERLSNIFDNAGQVIFGIVVLSPIIAEFDKLNLVVVIFGIVTMFACWLTSILLARKL